MENLQDIQNSKLFITIISLNQKLSLKYLEFIATKFFVTQTYYLKFYCNTSYQLLHDSNIIATIYFVAINIFFLGINVYFYSIMC